MKNFLVTILDGRDNEEQYVIHQTPETAGHWKRHFRGFAKIFLSHFQEPISVNVEEVSDERAVELSG